MMKRLLPVGVFCLPLVVLGAQLRGADPHFIKPADLDVVSLLPPPPAAGSDEANTELDVILKLQGTRTPAELSGKPNRRPN